MKYSKTQWLGLKKRAKIQLRLCHIIDMSWGGVNESLFVDNQGVFWILKSGWDGLDCGPRAPLAHAELQASVYCRGVRDRGGFSGLPFRHLQGCLCTLDAPVSHLLHSPTPLQPPSSSCLNSPSITSGSLVSTLSPAQGSSLTSFRTPLIRQPLTDYLL